MPDKLTKKRKVKEQLTVFNENSKSVISSIGSLNEIEDKAFDYDYRKVNASDGVHGIHPYPAMMIYPLARHLISTYADEGDTVLDPFVGSGTVLVESQLQNRNSIGMDINPLAILLAKVKTTPLIGYNLMKNLENILSIAKINNSVKKPNFFNLDFWFVPDVIDDLSKLLIEINKVKPIKIRNFFKVSFSETVRYSSKTNNGEFKLVRMKNHENFNPNVLSTFEKISMRNIGKIHKTYPEKIRSTVGVLDWDSREKSNLDEESIDLLLTSPPYGDSKTTVAYGQFSRLSLQWLGYEKVNIDNESLGGVAAEEIPEDLSSKALEKILTKIGNNDQKRAREVYSFFKDLEKSLSNILPLLKKKGHACFVIGNRTVKQITIPTDVIVREICEKLGMIYKETMSRNIINKRMPRINSPTNVEGITESTMNKEYIVILQKA